MTPHYWSVLAVLEANGAVVGVGVVSRTRRIGLRTLPACPNAEAPEGRQYYPAPADPVAAEMDLRRCAPLSRAPSLPSGGRGRVRDDVQETKGVAAFAARPLILAALDQYSAASTVSDGPGPGH
jgi:hypothetical protein